MLIELSISRLSSTRLGEKFSDRVILYGTLVKVESAETHLKSRSQGVEPCLLLGTEALHTEDHYRTRALLILTTNSSAVNSAMARVDVEILLRETLGPDHGNGSLARLEAR